MSNYSNQDPHLISIFEVLGAYVVDTVFNHVYHSATVRRSGEASLTDEYVRHIQAYVTGVKTDAHCYGDVIQGIHKYFINTTRHTTLGFADFVDRVVSVCVPAEYYRQFAVQDKDELLSSIVCDLVSNLAAYATEPKMLLRIIDEHTAASAGVTIRMLQDHALKTLLSKRAEITNKFLKRMGQAREHVSLATVDDMKKVLRRLVKEKAEALARAEDAEAALEEADATIEDLEAQLEKAKARERKALQLVNLLKSGKELGPEAAGTALALPKRETIAEPSKNGRRHGVIPPRESIAERHRGPIPKESKAPMAGGVPASFFKIANTDKQPPAALAMPASSSAKFTNLLDDVVSAGDSGEGFDGDILKDYY